MTLRSIDIDWKNIKTYTTEYNLLRRIEQDREMYPGNDDRFMIVRTPEGRWTAIVVLDKTTGGYLGRYEGFMKV